MQLAAAQFAKLKNIWKTKGTALETRLRLYNALVIPVLIYNAGTWGLTSEQSESLDKFHRRQLRQVLNVKWPHKISNNNLYKACKVLEPLSVKVARLRWSLFGHILRLDDEVPARKAMKLYCEQVCRSKGRPKTTLPVVLWGEAKKVLLKQPTLKWFIQLAQDRLKWFEFSEKVISFSSKVANIDETIPKRVAGASNKVERKLLCKKKVYRPTTLL